MEKTDYTYSRLSPYHNKEIIPGFTIRPNMSRLPLKGMSSRRNNTEETDSTNAIFSEEKIQNAPFKRKVVGRRLSFPEEKIRATDLVHKYWMHFALAALLILGIFNFIIRFRVLNQYSYQLQLGENSLQKVPINSGLEKLYREIGIRLKSLETAINELNKLKLATRNALIEAAKVQNRRHLHINPVFCSKVLHERTLAKDRIMKNVSLSLRNDAEQLYSNMQLKLPSPIKEAKRNLEPIISSMVAKAIRLYNADKTERADFALESSGGRVVSTRCTVNYRESSNPSAAIRPSTTPGDCWSFQGEGRLVLELSHWINVTGCSIEHISHSIHPLGYTLSAPRTFSLLGLSSEVDERPHNFGTFTYVVSRNETIQYFPVQYSSSRAMKLVEIVISSNHGHAEYTCLYRIRIHGQIHSNTYNNTSH